MQQISVKRIEGKKYALVYEAMRYFNDNRTKDSFDEIWILEHEPVYTIGQSGTETDIYKPSNIPVERTDRGGKITYHGPGQLIFYTLFDLARLNMGIKSFVSLLENSVIDTLLSYKIVANSDLKKRGVYVEQKKICSIGLRVRNSCTYHGIALNVDMDLSPFYNINPCGYVGMEVTQISDFLKDPNINEIAAVLSSNIINNIAKRKNSNDTRKDN